MRRLSSLLAVSSISLGLFACAGSTDDDGFETYSSADGDTGQEQDDDDAGDGDGDGDDGQGGVLFDVSHEGNDDGDPPNICEVNEDGNGTGACDQQAPPGSFDPVLQWTWEGVGNDTNSVTTPLVANFTDDNDDGNIDLCDTPDVMVLAGESVVQSNSHIYLLDGKTGEVNLQFEQDLQVDLNPAIGDIDNDGLPEIIAGTYNYIFGPNLVAFEHDGTVKWVGDGTGEYGDCLAIHDIDNDGDVEIVGPGVVYDHEGHKLFSTPGTSTWASNTAVDLDGDGDLEIVTGKTAYQHDGTQIYEVPDMVSGYPQVANLDDDPDPEILVTTYKGFWVLEHDGTPKFGPLTPTGDPPTGTTWERPATIHDFDGDGIAEFAQSSRNNYATYEQDGSLIWASPVAEVSGIAAGTAFDFLGDGGAEAMYADETNMFVFGEQGEVLFQVPRSSTTLTEYPIVADIDNDGSAEVVVISNGWGGQKSPTAQVISDKEDRWIPARRIWNQHAYFVTNVREDSTIPQFQEPHWEHLNTFRTNAQIQNGETCKPEG
jgi:hypothetical protein